MADAAAAELAAAKAAVAKACDSLITRQHLITTLDESKGAAITYLGLCSAGATNKAHYTFVMLTSSHRRLLTDAAQQWLDRRNA